MRQAESPPHPDILMISSVMTDQQHGFDHHSLCDTWFVPDPAALILGDGDVCPHIPLTAATRAFQIVQAAADTQDHTSFHQKHDPYPSPRWAVDNSNTRASLDMVRVNKSDSTQVNIDNRNSNPMVTHNLFPMGDLANPPKTIPLRFTSDPLFGISPTRPRHKPWLRKYIA